jgi:alpha-tubulin suppressor-like RCC1 family protein
MAALGWMAACLDSPQAPDEVARVTVGVDTLALALGDSARVTATVLDAHGREMGDRVVHWSSSDPRVSRVTNEGLVLGVGVGAAVITAESDARSGNTRVEVGVDIVGVAAGFSHSCALTTTGQAACWGSNSSGKLGNGTLAAGGSPMLVLTETPLAALSLGATQSCALDAAGLAHCWGNNATGQLGTGESDGGAHIVPAPVTSSPSFVTLVTGARHACGLDALGTTHCWGGGRWGQLGTVDPPGFCPSGGEICSVTPLPIDGGLRFKTLAAGQEHTCGLTADGAAYCWGLNLSGAIGDSSSESTRPTPVPVVGGLTFSTIAAGSNHTCATTVAGEAYCWGQNDGRLGDGKTATRSYPAPVWGGITFVQLSGGGRHTCGLTPSGAAYCWGDNLSGQLGVGTRTDTLTPVPVSGGLVFASISAGFSYTCGITTNGIAYCWGENVSGQLGTGVPGDQLTPAPVAGQ